MNLENVQCILCQSGLITVFHESKTENIHNRNVICERCGLIFISPRLREEDSLYYYKHGDYVKDHYGLKSEEDIDEIIHWRGRRAKEKIACFPDIFYGAKEILEVGAGTGVFLNELKKKSGASAFGIEPSAKFAQIARSRFGIEVYESTLRDYYEEYGTSRQFDLIIMDQVLEHLYDPLEAVSQAKNLLQKTGYLYVGVPNIANPKHSRGEFFIGPHTYTFSPWTILLLLWRAGLKIACFQAPPVSSMYLMATPLENPVPMFPLKDVPGPFSATELSEIIDNFSK